METFFERASRTPWTFVILIAYVTTFLMGMRNEDVQEDIFNHAACASWLVDREPWRLLSYAFLHNGILHIGFNSYCLLIAGPSLEEELGAARFLLLYAVTAIGGSMLACFTSPLSPVVGGSGALFGMFGAMLALYSRMGRSRTDFLSHHQPRRLISLIFLNLLIGLLVPFISNAAHVGGLIAGGVVTFCFLTKDDREPVDRTGWLVRVGWVAVFGASLLYTVAAPTRVHALCRRLRSEASPELRYRITRAIWIRTRESTPVTWDERDQRTFLEAMDQLTEEQLRRIERPARRR